MQRYKDPTTVREETRRKRYVVTDPDHEWNGKEIEILPNPGRGAMNHYVCRLKHGKKEERQYEKAVFEEQWERID